MRARTAAVVAAFALAACVAHAARHVGFEADAFNRVYPSAYAKDAVFSPLSFEIDCVAFAETMDTIAKAHVAETMGVLVDLEGVYGPLIEAFDVRTNGFSLVSARAFCVPDMRDSLPAFRRQLQRSLRVETCNLLPKDGAEAWLKATMDGEMEDFELPVSAAVSERYSYYDLVSVKASFLEPLPGDGTRRMQFRRADGTSAEMDFACGACGATVREDRDYSLVRIPLRGESVFFALIPKGKAGLADVKPEISSLEIDRLLSVSSGGTPVRVAIPPVSISSRFEFSQVLRYYRFQYSGLVRIAGARPPREIVQEAKFSLAATDEAAKPVEASADAPEIAFDKPFVFFVYHEATGTMPIAGQFTGVRQ